MSTQIRRQGDVAIVEPSGRLMGPSVVELREGNRAANRGFRRATYPHQL